MSLFKISRRPLPISTATLSRSSRAYSKSLGGPYLYLRPHYSSSSRAYSKSPGGPYLYLRPHYHAPMSLFKISRRPLPISTATLSRSYEPIQNL
ncbi:hypothetical protein RRG08_037587 [Elysia crispata]|uniref:Uncharacterized protein n=1 Tax=Elysia crispata TaxID=231223 RepID=A0AAE1AF76_9GAST|nr:hypothetical protein RRG08_037587 [Elysia crispata]